MDFTLGLACSHMMMECPRCGFAQPKDRYCASCGLDIEQFEAKPKPLWVRLVQNPNLHLSLIAILILLVVGYIFYVQKGLVSRQVGALFNGTPLSSRDSGDPNTVKSLPPPPPPPPSESHTEAVLANLPAAKTAELAPPAAAEAQKVEVSYWEIPREAMTALLVGSEKTGEGSGGHAYLWAQGGKAIETIQASARRLAMSRTMPLESGAQVSVETPPTTPESFQFGLYFQLSKPEGKDPSVKWESTMVLPPAETAAEAAAGARQPVVKALSESTLNGSASLTPTSALLLVFEPPNRTPREELIAKAGEGPWTIFGSYEFRSNTTEWVVLVQLK